MENREIQKWKIKIQQKNNEKEKKSEQRDDLSKHMEYKLKYYAAKALYNAWFLKCWDLFNLWLCNKA